MAIRKFCHETGELSLGGAGALDCLFCPRLNTECKLSEIDIFFFFLSENITFTDCFGGLFSGFASKYLTLASNIIWDSFF